ncbi:hypothetical protein [Amycolatopsis sp. YIM 10]|uniref:hypothetical protein n=1 Tax=Amycolatopsis sp. YIM 10 TaxID=2653857 RepID=UPI00129062DC|nr:hypothetical protein [Amycolatopsis sp. YIM 10]QFU87860.1 hypothetical protein YIM_13370 [Amycolatopsis sp. YIM 10]QFU94827.1 hypothetical protein YIM_48510 [Amycolatopsis sp. YIM 10]
MTDELWVIVRTGGTAPELVGAWSDPGEAAKLAEALGPGHALAPVTEVKPGTAFVAHVWRCRATVTPGAGFDLDEPQKLAGASRIVIDTADMPAERVHVDEEAAELNRAVHGENRQHLEAFAATAERAAELAAEKARELGGSPA